MFVARVLALVLALVVAPALSSPVRAEPTIATEVSIVVGSPVTYGDVVTVSGQVSYVDPDGGQEYALADAPVLLERRYLDSSEWTEVAAQVTAGAFPGYEFEDVATKGARYRVSYAGDETYQASAAEATVRVRRIVTSKVREPRDDVFFLKGKVVPDHAGEPVALLRKKCSDCAWKVFRRGEATARSTYRFRLPLPPEGAHYFRARVPADEGYLRTVSKVWEIRRIR
ncbi:MAG TPA: hypothetical protein VFR87_03715 [Nocardioidaceae bacterium]|nr:hypothetical protein [Nocardioidaceae bacterium]